MTFHFACSKLVRDSYLWNNFFIYGMVFSRRHPLVKKLIESRNRTRGKEMVVKRVKPQRMNICIFLGMEAFSSLLRPTELVRSLQVCGCVCGISNSFHCLLSGVKLSFGSSRSRISGVQMCREAAGRLMEMFLHLFKAGRSFLAWTHNFIHGLFNHHEIVVSLLKTFFDKDALS